MVRKNCFKLFKSEDDHFYQPDHQGSIKFSTTTTKKQKMQVLQLKRFARTKWLIIEHFYRFYRLRVVIRMLICREREMLMINQHQLRLQTNSNLTYQFANVRKGIYTQYGFHILHTVLQHPLMFDKLIGHSIRKIIIRMRLLSCNKLLNFIATGQVDNDTV